ncbi:hypothetical protein EV182_000209 [Spiromyces aspiralis]|uniref:Uncharacterized protein n=1 Tax=Spiromyces aspiralis TaxID=68401 RepID=A0ACC1HUU2_9FUNG|nr:hypothetical protein EV182_000209 [Spiromyces aspiralis]
MSTSATTSAAATGRHHRIVIVGGDTLIGYCCAMECLKHKEHHSHVRVGYMNEHSPFLKDLKSKGAEMMHFKLDDMSSMQRMYKDMMCGIICPLVFCEHYDKAKCAVEAALKADSLKHMVMMSMMHADKMRDFDRLRPMCEMEQMFEHGMDKWDEAYIMRLSMPLESFYNMRRMIQQDREMPWPTRDQKVAPVSYFDVAKAARCLFVKEHDVQATADDSDTEESTAKSLARTVRERIKAIALAGRDQQQQQQRRHKFCMTGPESCNGEEIAEMCSRALGTRIQLKAMSPDDFAKCLKKMGELPDEHIKTLKQIAEVIHKGMWKDKCDDLEKILDRKPMTVEKYFQRNSDSFKPHQ